MGFYFKVRSAKTISKATWSARKGNWPLYLLYLAWDISNKGAPDGSMSETRSLSRQAYEGEVEQWAVERAGSMLEPTEGHAWAYISRCEVRKLSQRQPGVHVMERPLYLRLAWDMSIKGAPDCVV